jgi:hypothetical protein
MLKLFFSEFISLPTHLTIDPKRIIPIKKSIALPGICAYDTYQDLIIADV